MSSNVKELFASWPFLPEATLDDAVRNIRDVRLVYTMPAGDPVSSGVNSDGIKATLVSIGSASAVFWVNLSAYGITASVTVPVYTGIDTYPTTDSYVLVADPVTQTTLSRSYRLHPDCLVILQEPPALSISLRSHIDTDFEAHETSVHTFAAGETLKFVKGHNVALSGSSSDITWAVQPRAGLGEFGSFPYYEFENRTIEYGQGLRSICGLTGEVRLAVVGDSAKLTVERDLDTQITVSLGAAE